MAVDPLAKFIEMASKLRTTVSEEMDSEEMIGAGEVKVGHGDDNIVMGADLVEINNTNPSIGMTLSGAGSKVRYGGSLKTDIPPEKTVYPGNLTENPQMQYRAPNIVNHYPVYVKLPPGILGGLIRGVLGGIISIVKYVESEKDAE